jgi:hypothetical protein
MLIVVLKYYISICRCSVLFKIIVLVINERWRKHPHPCVGYFWCGCFRYRPLCFEIHIKGGERNESFNIPWWARILSNKWMVTETPTPMRGCTKVFPLWLMLVQYFYRLHHPHSLGIIAQNYRRILVDIKNHCFDIYIIFSMVDFLKLKDS